MRRLVLEKAKKETRTPRNKSVRFDTVNISGSIALLFGSHLLLDANLFPAQLFVQPNVHSFYPCGETLKEHSQTLRGSTALIRASPNAVWDHDIGVAICVAFTKVRQSIKKP